MKKNEEQLMSTQHWRQLDIADPEQLQDKITVIGVGSIGSFVTLALAKMGCGNIEVYDFDKVELHNLPNQFYRKNDCGKPKVVALQGIIQDFTGINITINNEKFETQHISGGYVIFAVDNMDARMKIWHDVIKLNPMIKKLIDARMGGEVFRVLSVNPADIDDIEYYEKLLYPTKDAIQLPCSAQSIIYNILGVSSTVVNIIKKVMLLEKVPREVSSDLKKLSFYKSKTWG